ncbi:hypothetical protein BC938DRAFT_480095 [Jimgerdemannia flammicorona]|uniref:Uncharacterized protein n=1 Tax=Jimgerdemannia flammicorona TaxID=994334 RepID=A0A433QJE2_9FUNG|nr:hypothetical protein BC938DRAFT_480095 [Jimgerdemannia flammicorona]
MDQARAGDRASKNRTRSLRITSALRATPIAIGIRGRVLPRPRPSGSRPASSSSNDVLTIAHETVLRCLYAYLFDQTESVSIPSPSWCMGFERFRGSPSLVTVSFKSSRPHTAARRRDWRSTWTRSRTMIP